MFLGRPCDRPDSKQCPVVPLAGSQTRRRATVRNVAGFPSHLGLCIANSSYLSPPPIAMRMRSAPLIVDFDNLATAVSPGPITGTFQMPSSILSPFLP